MRPPPVRLPKIVQPLGRRRKRPTARGRPFGRIVDFLHQPVDQHVALPIRQDMLGLDRTDAIVDAKESEFQLLFLA